ncbi:unnamed protein product [Gemmataceae bacterium]|nr:unnamed protein product [Gemmataceae bacterium]VTT96538.1 unnamed protein product [Gemmataceae bacterium]
MFALESRSGRVAAHSSRMPPRMVRDHRVALARATAAGYGVPRPFLPRPDVEAVPWVVSCLEPENRVTRASVAVRVWARGAPPRVAVPPRWCFAGIGLTLETPVENPNSPPRVQARVVWRSINESAWGRSRTKFCVLHRAVRRGRPSCEGRSTSGAAPTGPPCSTAGRTLLRHTVASSPAHPPVAPNIACAIRGVRVCTAAVEEPRVSRTVTKTSVRDSAWLVPGERPALPPPDSQSCQLAGPLAL